MGQNTHIPEQEPEHFFETTKSVQPPIYAYQMRNFNNSFENLWSWTWKSSTWFTVIHSDSVFFSYSVFPQKIHTPKLLKKMTKIFRNNARRRLQISGTRKICTMIRSKSTISMGTLRKSSLIRTGFPGTGSMRRPGRAEQCRPSTLRNCWRKSRDGNFVKILI